MAGRTPCPDSAVGAQFAEAFDGFTTVAEECATAARSVPGYRPQDLDEKAAMATVLLMQAMYAIRAGRVGAAGSRPLSTHQALTRANNKAESWTP